MKTILIREHKHGSIEMIRNVPDNVSATAVVEAWSKRTFHYLIYKKRPAITWKVAENNDIVAVMIEASKL